MKNRTTLTLVLLFFLVELSKAQTTSDFFKETNMFFNTHIEDGKVDYKTIKENPTSLNQLISLANDISVLKEDAKIYQSFWINAYNLAVIKGIVDNYPIKSPLNKKGFFDEITYQIGGENITLNEIEHKVLRGNFPDEARFHFVLVCAGLGCPPIINKAYLPETLDHQLQTQTELALNDPNFIRVKGKKVQLSQLFEWYKADFTKDGKSQIDYVNQFRKEKIDSKAKVSYYEYDWALNETK
ncbi:MULTISPECIES: DUF547 domain-containing protein [Croceitalea]|uniref:DUF547 domain-containing protein n=1 Tax=Croceitalea vernalis TaxID=3075599 RepID=A0ABU3BC62_9FLAO|nr:MULTISPECIES: DUF547 domain-containing protein [unclassified Croceitalea]MDT0538277.1 DUF547 domain-containing protein [Croceitalea sp. P059]MDT0620061.1 DUF547 domain-containing protein [Croceitalea sp. P007]